MTEEKKVEVLGANGNLSRDVNKNTKVIGAAHAGKGVEIYTPKGKESK